MHILVILKMVPDVVEELELALDHKSLDTEYLRLVLSESDDHALEEALLLKERHGAKVTVAALEAPDIDDTLFTALAKGADRAVKVTGAEEGLTTRGAAFVLSQVLLDGCGLLPADLVLTGAQAIDDVDGLAAPLVAYHLGWPYVGIVTGAAVDPAAAKASVVREYPGGVRGEFEVNLPAVLGIQSAEKPPRYVPVAKVRAAMKTLRIEAVTAPAVANGGAGLARVVEMSKPAATGRAEMLEGDAENAAAKLCTILSERGVL